MQQIPSVVKKYFKGAELMISDWEVEQVEEQLNWMLYECNRQRDVLEEQSAELIEAMEVLVDYKEREREKSMGLHQSNRCVGSLL